MVIYVSVYNVESCYGGPEEGGWWYDYYRLLDSFQLTNQEEADKLWTILSGYCNQKNASEETQRRQNTANMPEGNSPWLDTEGYIPIGWGDGGKVRVRKETVRGAWTTTERPHYC